MIVRDWKQEDMPTLAQLHGESVPGYQLPKEFGPLYCVQKTVLSEEGKIVAMAAVKLTSEGFLWVDPKSPKITRTKALIMLNETCKEEAKKIGLEDCSAWPPPQLQRTFGKILRKLGWRRSPWRNWTLVL